MLYVEFRKFLCREYKHLNILFNNEIWMQNAEFMHRNIFPPNHWVTQAFSPSVFGRLVYACKRLGTPFLQLRQHPLLRRNVFTSPMVSCVVNINFFVFGLIWISLCMFDNICSQKKCHKYVSYDNIIYLNIHMAYFKITIILNLF